MRRSNQALVDRPAPSPSSAGTPNRPVAPPPLPDYLRDTYTWAYLSDFGTRFFDHQLVVNTILWGNARRLIRWACSALRPGQTVLQPAAVYGSFSRDVAATLGPQGQLTVCDVAPVQVALTTRKVADLATVTVCQHDATQPHDKAFDAIVCFFLLHEVPDPVKTAIVDALLASVKPGGSVIFVDYHQTAPWHPLRPVMAGVFRFLEPFAQALCRRDIRDYASTSQQAEWRKETRFGGLYQRVIATRLPT